MTFCYIKGCKATLSNWDNNIECVICHRAYCITHALSLSKYSSFISMKYKTRKRHIVGKLCFGCCKKLKVDVGDMV